MIFKPESEHGEAKSYHSIESNIERKESIRNLGREHAKGREDGNQECTIISDPGTTLTESSLTNEQTKMLNSMLDSMTGWHISPNNQKEVHITKPAKESCIKNDTGGSNVVSN